MSCEPPDSLTHSCNVYLSHRYLVSFTTSRQRYTTNFLYIPFILLLFCSCHYIHVFSYVNKSTKWCCWPWARTSVSLHATITYSLLRAVHCSHEKTNRHWNNDPWAILLRSHTRSYGSTTLCPSTVHDPLSSSPATRAMQWLSVCNELISETQ